MSISALRVQKRSISAVSRQIRPGGVLLLCAVLFVLTACHSEVNSAKSATKLTSTSIQTHKHLASRYVCPMHPNIIKEVPGTCPICGMTLVKKKIDLDAGAYPKVTLNPAVVQNMGIRTAKVTRGGLWRFIKTVGYVSYDQDRLSVVDMRTEGWVENMAVRVVGLHVKKGQLLFELYSPEFLKTQKAFIAAQKKDESGINKQYSRRQESVDARDHLRYLQITESMINEIARTGRPQFRIPIYAPQQGTIIKFDIYKHKYIYPYEELLTIADTSTVWVEARVYEHQLAWIHLGLKADVIVKAVPGQVYHGEVNYIYPELDSKTRSLRVRLRVPNTDGRLKPNMFAYVHIYGGLKKDILKIPREALIETGERESVILNRGKGKFQPVDVVTGMRSDKEIEILSGLKQGDSVVSSGQFLIDSEANIQASFKRLQHHE